VQIFTPGMPVLLAPKIIDALGYSWCRIMRLVSDPQAERPWTTTTRARDSGTDGEICRDGQLGVRMRRQRLLGPCSRSACSSCPG
jgi:hypothetical protein